MYCHSGKNRSSEPSSSMIPSQHVDSRSSYISSEMFSFKEARIICFSHKEDVDGISSAALVKAAYKTKVLIVLVDYVNIVAQIQKIALLTYSLSEEKSLRKRRNVGKKLFICDLALSEKDRPQFIRSLLTIISNGYKVIYIDHHHLTQNVKLELRKIGVILIHSTEDCASILVYKILKKKLNSHATFIAAAGAITDQMENSPLASSIISRFDGQYLMLESAALSYMISASQDNDPFLAKIVNTLSEMRYPHEIEDGFLIAERYANKVSQVVKSAEKSIMRKENVAYIQGDNDIAASTLVNFILGISGQPVAIVYNVIDKVGSCVLAIRGMNCQLRLGRLVNDIALSVGGSGGGHDKDCGAVIPKNKINEFIARLNKSIE